MEFTQLQFRGRRVLPALLFCFIAISLPGSSWAQSTYYEGKVLTILRGGAPGGYGDLQARALIPFLEKYIPGNPTIVIEYMRGAAGRKAANHMYLSVRPDGLTVGAVGNGLVTGPILGMMGTEYDLDRFIYLGSTESGSPSGIVTRKEIGLDSIEKLQAATGVRIGAHSVGHITYITGRLSAYLLGLKEPKFVVGYSGPERVAALLRGEVDAGSMSAATATQNPTMPDQVDIHAVYTVPKGRYIPPFSTQIPEIDVFAKTEKERQILSLYRSFLYPRWPYFLPPGTPEEPVNILRQAVEKSFADPGFPKLFKKLTGAVPSPLSWREVETAIKEIPRDEEVIALYKHMADHRPLPPR